MNMKKNTTRCFDDEERRLRVRMMEMNVRQIDVAAKTGISKQDVNHVIRGKSRSPRYIAEIYKYLGLEQL